MPGVRTKNSNPPYPGIRGKHQHFLLPDLSFWCREWKSQFPQIHSVDGQLCPAGCNFAVAPASLHAHAERVTTIPAKVPPTWSSSTASCTTGDGKRQNTAPIHEDPCAPAQFNRRAPSTIARAPRHGGPAEIIAEAMGSVPTWLPPTIICDNNRANLPGSIGSRFHIHMGLEPRPLILRIINPAERTEMENVLVTSGSPCNQCHC